jgi:hypothetical protein
MRNGRDLAIKLLPFLPFIVLFLALLVAVYHIQTRGAP